MSRKRQFGNLRSSRNSSESFNFQTNRETQSKDHSKGKLCINCVNKSLSKQKQIRNLLLKQADKRRGQQLQHSRQVREEQLSKSYEKRKAMQYQHMIEYNKQVSRQLSQKKIFEKMRKQQERKREQVEQKRLIYERECTEKRQRLLAEKLFKDIKQQITLKQSRNKQQKQKQVKTNSFILNKMSPQQASLWQQQRKNQYRIELTEQMQREAERKNKQKQLQKKQFDIRSNPLIERAQQRHQILKQIQQQRKQQLLEDAKRRQAELVKKKQQIQAENKRERETLKAVAADEEQRSKQAYRRKKQYIKQYQKEVNQDISLKELKNKQSRINKTQAPDIHPMFYSSFERAALMEHCGGCDKNFPSSYLTQFVQP